MKNWKAWVAASSLTLALMVPVQGHSFAEQSDMMAAKIDYSKLEVRTVEGMELVPLRQAAEMLGFSVEWNGMERSITLSRSKMGMEESGMAGKEMMEESMMGKEMMENGMMENGMMENGMMEKEMMENDVDENDMMEKYTVKITIGSKTALVSMTERMLENVPVLLDHTTYVTKPFVESFLAGAPMMN
ncbi:hypothetical protein ACFFK0_22665 [Paenibacillus chartarius]|uniref:Copper amine oxidase-like N-terminal domain-containing protein n=1 Tax=Paenibacillus chartarius TaxID=747481 RepID=A0ABV6DRD1_9BACL